MEAEQNMSELTTKNEHFDKLDALTKGEVEDIRVGFWKGTNVSYAVNAIVETYPFVQTDADGFKFPSAIVRDTVKRPDAVTAMFVGLAKHIFDTVLQNAIVGEDGDNYHFHNRAFMKWLRKQAEDLWDRAPTPVPDGDMEDFGEDDDWCLKFVREYWASMIHCTWFTEKLEDVASKYEITGKVDSADVPNYPAGPFPIWYTTLLKYLPHTSSDDGKNIYLCSSDKFVGVEDIQETGERAVLRR